MGKKKDFDVEEFMEDALGPAGKDCYSFEEIQTFVRSLKWLNLNFNKDDSKKFNHLIECEECKTKYVDILFGEIPVIAGLIDEKKCTPKELQKFWKEVWKDVHLKTEITVK